MTVKPFAGAVMQFSLAGVPVTDPGTHLELWARDANNDILRLAPYYQENKFLSQPGFIVKPAITVDDPCMTDGAGHLLTDASAYPSSVTEAGVTQTPLQQAQQIINRIDQLNPPGMTPLLAVLPFTSVAEPTFADTPTPAERQAACDAASAADPNFYIPQPKQVTAPIHGAVYGFIAFSTISPPADYDGFRFDVPTNLKGVQALFFTLETVDIADVKEPGQLYIVSQLVPGGRDILQFSLTPAGTNGPSGTVAVEDTLDEDPVEF
ncbi:MAG TPA: hypothetical protein VIA18_18245 [Polyangia bacterium]|nr:hypothetical protein [Polyangia bacterium]